MGQAIEIYGMPPGEVQPNSHDPEAIVFSQHGKQSTGPHKGMNEGKGP